MKIGEADLLIDKFKQAVRGNDAVKRIADSIIIGTLESYTSYLLTHDSRQSEIVVETLIEKIKIYSKP